MYRLILGSRVSGWVSRRILHSRRKWWGSGQVDSTPRRRRVVCEQNRLLPSQHDMARVFQILAFLRCHWRISVGQLNSQPGLLQLEHCLRHVL